MTDRNDIKNAIDNIQPDAYMKTRLRAKVNEYKKPRRAGFMKKAGAGILALAILCGSLGAYEITRNSRSDSPADFTVIAYASDGEQITNETPLTDEKIAIPDVRMVREENGETHQRGSGGFIIDAEDINTITIKSEHGEFIYYDTPKQDYDERVKGIINYIEIPLTDEEYADYLNNYSTPGVYNQKSRERCREFAKKIIENKDCKKYFGKNSMNLKLYDFDICGKEASTKGTNLMTLMNLDKISKRYDHMGESECVIKQYDSKEKVEIGYVNNDVFNFFDDESLDVTQTPKDTITITVKFNSGQKVTKRLRVSFNSDAVMEIEFVK